MGIVLVNICGVNVAGLEMMLSEEAHSLSGSEMMYVTHIAQFTVCAEIMQEIPFF